MLFRGVPYYIKLYYLMEMGLKAESCIDGMLASVNILRHFNLTFEYLGKWRMGDMLQQVINITRYLRSVLKRKGQLVTSHHRKVKCWERNSMS